MLDISWNLMYIVRNTVKMNLNLESAIHQLNSIEVVDCVYKVLNEQKVTQYIYQYTLFYFSDMVSSLCWSIHTAFPFSAIYQYQGTVFIP